MTRPEHIEALIDLGYNDQQSRFLYLVATHSGYFTLRQFLDYTGTSKGRNVHEFTSKSIRLGHVRAVTCGYRTSAMEALQKLMGRNTKPSTQMQFAELVRRWKAAEVPAMKSSTATHYQNVLRLIEPVFGTVEIAKITRHDVERFIHDRARTYSRSTLRSLRTALSLVLGYATSNE
jgi:hypothetical protein